MKRLLNRGIVAAVFFASPFNVFAQERPVTIVTDVSDASQRGASSNAHRVSDAGNGARTAASVVRLPGSSAARPRDVASDIDSISAQRYQIVNPADNSIVWSIERSGSDLVFLQAGTTPRFKVAANGDISTLANLGVGTATAPEYSIVAKGSSPRISVQDNGSSYALLQATNSNNVAWFGTAGTAAIATDQLAYAAIVGSANNYPTQFITNGAVRMTVDTSGNVGVGTTTPETGLEVKASANSEGIRISGVQSPGFEMYTNSPDSRARNWGWYTNYNSLGDLAYTVSTSNTGSTWGNAPVLTMLSSGNVGIGISDPAYKLHVAGSAHFAGTVTGANIRAHYQDLAEWVPAAEELAPATVVVIKKNSTNVVTASTDPYDTTVAGVVSADPGITLGVAGPDMVQVATTGRVKVRVDATRIPIAAGDLLVTSETSGTAMRSEPLKLGGRTFHQPGTIIGKALEPLRSGVGEILVLLSLQ